MNKWNEIEYYNIVFPEASLITPEHWELLNEEHLGYMVLMFYI